MNRRHLMQAVLAATAAAAAGATRAFAQEVYPSRPVRLVVPYPPGGTTDIVGRLVARRLSDIWGQPVVVENRAGAGGSVGTAVVAKSPADGYTLVLGNSASHGANVLLNPNAPYDPVRDFAPISLLAIVKQVLVVHPSVPARSVRELVALAKAQPGKLTFGSSAVGGAPHLAGELFKQVAGVDLLHVPYNGAAPAMNALVGGVTSLMFASVPTTVELVRANRLRPLAIASSTRSGLLPDVMTMAEAGYPGVEMDSWFGLLAPAGVPAPILAKLHTDVLRAVDGEEVRKRMADIGFERSTGSAQSFGAMIAREMERMRRLIADAKITGH